MTFTADGSKGPPAVFVTKHSAVNDGSPMHEILEKLKEEFFAILPPTIFFFVALHIVAVVRVLMARGSHFEPLSTISIILFVLILVYCTARELVRVIGKEKMLRLFFGPMPLPAF
jgi:hypothetical protein